MNTNDIRRQVYELSPDDLERYAVWEFALEEEGNEGQDEATVRPYPVNGLIDPADGMFVVRARLTLADGTAFIGYVTPPVQGETGLGTFQPAVVVPGGQVSFWCGIVAPSMEHISSCYVLMGKASASQVFPLTFESDVPLTCGPVVGSVPGFLVVDDLKTMRTRVVD